MKTKFEPRFFARADGHVFGDGTVYIQYLKQNHVQGINAKMQVVWEDKQYSLAPDWFANRSHSWDELSMMQAAQRIASINGQGVNA